MWNGAGLDLDRRVGAENGCAEVAAQDDVALVEHSYGRFGGGTSPVCGAAPSQRLAAISAAAENSNKPRILRTGSGSVGLCSAGVGIMLDRRVLALRDACDPSMRESAPVEYALLGPLAVTCDGEAVDIAGPRHRTLLAALLLGRGRVVSIDDLVDALWDEDPPTNARSTLQTYVSQLRKELGPRPSLETLSPGYRLGAAPEAVDAWRFELLAADGRARLEEGDVAGGRRTLEQALGLWRGPALAEFRDRQFARAEAVRLDELRADVEEDLWSAALELGEGPRLVGDLEVGSATHPLRERRWELLMLALHHSGRSADALRAYRRAYEHLGSELGIEPGDALRRLEERILLGDPNLGGRIPAGERHNLPTARNRFVGRAEEQAGVEAALASARLVTLTGPGGTGKTRLALEVARAGRAAYPGGAWLVELASVGQAEAIAGRIAASLGVPAPGQTDPAATLRQWFGGRRLLLVVDNCEHLADAVADLVDELLDGAPGLTVLATSRQPLGVTGEVVWPVPALDHAPAVELFEDRARAADARVRLGPESADAVAQIAQRLDGLPLAIELAAARIATLSVDDIERRLDDRFALLTGGARTAVARHRTLHAAVGWSYDLLDDQRRLGLRQLARFAGPFGLSGAAAITAEGSGDALDLVDGLVRQSLVVADRDEDGSVHYRLLDTIREFARAETTAEEAEATRRRHARYLADLVEQHGPGLGASEPETVARALASLGRSVDDLRAALAWAVESGESALALRMVSASSQYWWTTGKTTEGHQWAEAALAGPVDPATPVELMTSGRLAAAQHAAWLAELERAAELFAQVEADARRVGDASMQAAAAAGHANVCWLRGDWDETHRLRQQAVELAEVAGDTWEMVRAHRGLAALYLRRSEFAPAGRHLTRAVQLAGDVPVLRNWLDYDRGILLTRKGDYAAADELLTALVQRQVDTDKLGAHGTALRDLANLHLLVGRLDQARDEIEQSLEASHRRGDRWGIAASLAVAGIVLAALGDPAAEAAAVRSRELFATLRDPWGVAWAELALVHAADDVAAARRHAEHAADEYRRLGDRWGEAEALEALAFMVDDEGEVAQLRADADRLRGDIGVSVPPVWAARR